MPRFFRNSSQYPGYTEKWHANNIVLCKAMTQEKELYHFLKLYSVDFYSAKHIRQVLKRYRRKDVRYCILRDLIVTYCRPFSGNKGDKIANHKLTIQVVPREL